MIDLPVKYISLNWQYWLGIAAFMLGNIMVMTNDKHHYQRKWLYFVSPLGFGILIYVLGSIVGAYI